MLPRRVEDYRTLFWTLVLTPALVVILYLRPELGFKLLPVSSYFAIATGVIAHNHMHRPTLRAKWANELFSDWISIFYGYPVFAWTPTHNLNHHRFVNRRGDATITWRYTNKHNAWVAATYFFVSAYFQSAWIKRYIQGAKRNKPEVFKRIVWQYVVTYGVHGAAIALAVSLYGFETGLRICAGPASARGAVDDHALQLHTTRAHRSVVRAQPLSKFRRTVAQLLTLRQRLSHDSP